MWHPDDPPDLRWLPKDGLVGLIGMACCHLFREAYWRETGKWLGPEVHPREQDEEKVKDAGQEEGAA
jgi:hypothetical protein